MARSPSLTLFPVTAIFTGDIYKNEDGSIDYQNVKVKINEDRITELATMLIYAPKNTYVNLPDQLPLSIDSISRKSLGGKSRKSRGGKMRKTKKHKK